jgi:hypothetical protein
MRFPFASPRRLRDIPSSHELSPRAIIDQMSVGSGLPKLNFVTELTPQPYGGIATHEASSQSTIVV